MVGEISQGGMLAGGLRMLVSWLFPFFTIKTVFIPQLKCLLSWQCIAHTPGDKVEENSDFVVSGYSMFKICKSNENGKQSQNYRKYQDY